MRRRYEFFTGRASRKHTPRATSTINVVAGRAVDAGTMGMIAVNGMHIISVRNITAFAVVPAGAGNEASARSSSAGGTTKPVVNPITVMVAKTTQ